jgi:hypothetical protein
MRIASSLVILVVLALAGLTVGCGGGDDDGDSTETPTGAATRTSRAPRTGTPSTAASPTSGDEKPTPGGNGGENPVPTQGGGAAPPPAAEGTPAAEPPDTGAYLSQFQGRFDLGEEGCQYNPSTRVTDCGARGRYAVNPPLSGQDIFCFIAIVGGNPEYIYCMSAEPSETKFYDIQ